MINVGSCFRNISLSNTLPDTLQAIKVTSHDERAF